MMMKGQAQQVCIFLSLSLVFLSFTIGGEGHLFRDSVVGGGRNLRRILHQPLFPEISSPPPVVLPPPSPPPSPIGPEFPNPDQPFFPEVPSGQTPDQVQQSPPVQAANGTTQSHSVPIATPSQQPNKPAKKVAIALSVGIVTLGMLSALAFYLYKHRVKHPDDSHKLVGANSQRINEESRMPPSTFLYIGTVEPSTQSTVAETKGENDSPYRKLNSIKRSERYRPSPDLQPLPPLTKPPPPPAINSPPPMSSSDEESHDTAFYTPQGSSVSNEEGTTPSSRRSQRSNTSTSLAPQPRVENPVNTSVPHSKRTSPKSRLYASSPDVRPAIIPSIKQSPAPPPPPSPPPSNSESFDDHPCQVKPNKQALTFTPKRPKFSAPPPPPDIARLQKISNQGQGQATTKAPLPPPPPPPPPVLPAPRKVGATSEKSTPPTASRPLIMPKSMSASPKTIEKAASSEELNKGTNGTSSSDRHDGDDMEGSKPKLKPLHWDKVRATSDRATVWDQLKSSSFQLNEDMMESLFGFNSGNSATKESTRKSVLPPVEQENRVLDPKKSQNIAILLRALNVTKDEVSEALLDGNPEGLGPELLETLVKMAPTKEEEIKLRNYDGEISRLGSAERFLKAILDVPFAFKRVEAMLYRANFDSEVNYLKKSFQTLKEASQELKDSRLFLKLLEAVLMTGNRMNVGTNRGDARAFKLDTLLKLVDVKGTDGKTTLLHFVVQEIIRSEGSSFETVNETNVKLKEDDFKKQGLQVVAGLSKELGNVRKAAAMDSDVLSSYVSKLEIGLEKVRLVLQYEKQGMQGNFFSAMKSFLKEAEDDIIKIKDEEKKALSSVKDVTEYFHGNAAKEEAHPFRIFVIVRDFFSILDAVCKEVGKFVDRSMVMGTGRSFRMPATASLPVLSRYNGRHDGSSDDDNSFS